MLTMGRLSVKDVATGAIVASGLDYLEARRARRAHPGPAILVDEEGDEIAIGGRPPTGERRQYQIPALPSEWETIDRAAADAGLPTTTWLRAAALAAAEQICRLVPAGSQAMAMGASRTRGERRVPRSLRAHPEEWAQIEEAARRLGQTPRRWLREAALAEARLVLGE